jgi:hypothetical protein
MHVAQPPRQDNWREKMELQNELDMRRDASRPQAQDTGPLVQIEGPDGPQYATREQAVGQKAYVGRDKPDAANVKLQNDARMKMPRLNSVLRSLDRVEKASQAIASNRAFDGGELDKYAIDRTKEGRELVAAIAQMRPALTALTRVPGIGSQSDLEARLDGLQYPSSDLPPEVRQANIEELKAFVSDLKDVYETALNGGQPKAGGVPTFATEAEAEAARLAPGTRVVIGGVSGTWQ